VKQSQELYAVLIALPGGDTLLLPKVAVAEVLSADALQPSAAGPEWIAGTCLYNGRTLPVVNFEALNGTPGASGPRMRVVVLNGISDKLSVGQLALLGNGYPHLVTLNQNALTAVPLSDRDRDDLILVRVKIANTAAGIPNLDTLEDELVRAAPSA
jgi:chemosensory pili system protein ChpC